jgi:hypothetical protein
MCKILQKYNIFADLQDMFVISLLSFVIQQQILYLTNQCSLFMTVRHIFWDQWGWPPTLASLVTHAHWWTLDFANAFISPGVNSRVELVPSPRAYARNGAPRRWLGNYTIQLCCVFEHIFSVHLLNVIW